MQSILMEMLSLRLIDTCSTAVRILHSCLSYNCSQGLLVPVKFLYIACKVYAIAEAWYRRS